MAKSKELKIVITGPGRSGTTFLVKLFTFAGFATGFSEEFIESSASADVGWADTPGGDATQNLGLEHPVDAINSSRLEVLKSPEWSLRLEDLESMRNIYDLDVYLVVPVRNTSDIARSRIRRASPTFGKKHIYFGGPISGRSPDDPKAFEAEKRICRGISGIDQKRRAT